MKNNRNENKGFSKLSVMAILIIVIFTASAFTSCSGSKENSMDVKRESTPEVKGEISDTSMAFTGNIAQTTCLDCHPAIKDNGFDIDFTKVEEAGMIIDKGQDVKKKEKKGSEK